MSGCSHCCTQNSIYQCLIYLYNIAAGPIEAFLKKKFRFSFVCKVTEYLCFEYPVAFHPLPLCFITSKNASCGRVAPLNHKRSTNLYTTNEYLTWDVWLLLLTGSRTLTSDLKQYWLVISGNIYGSVHIFISTTQKHPNCFSPYKAMETLIVVIIMCYIYSPDLLHFLIRPTTNEYLTTLEIHCLASSYQPEVVFKRSCTQTMNYDYSTIGATRSGSA